jgi:hypothetical protein
MAKSASDKPTASADEALKRRKKQARQEAKLMLEIEAAKRALKKAQKKQSRAQARLEERSTSVHTLETRLAELCAKSVEPEIAAPPQSVELVHQQEQAELESSIGNSNGKQQALPDQEDQGEITALTERTVSLLQAEAGMGIASSPETETSTFADEEQKSPFVEEARPSEVMVMTKDVTEGEAALDKKPATESDPSPTKTTPGKASTQKTDAARTSTATKRSTSSSTAAKRPASQSTTTKRPASRSQSTRKSPSDTENKGA